MRMKDDYMKNGQLKPGYNLQIATENQFTLSYALYPNPTDTRTLPDFLATHKSWHGVLPTYIVADAGYGSESNCQHILDDCDRIPLITYGTYYREKKKKAKENPFLVSNWLYEEKEDLFICPNRRPVSFKRHTVRTDTYGFKRDTKVYECENCHGCPLRSQCTKAKSDRNRQVHLNPTWEYFKSYTKEKLSDEKTSAIYKKRKVDVEPVFGFLKAHLGFTRVHVRGHEQVTNELGLALMAVNLRKLAVRWRGKSLKKETTWKSSVILNFSMLFFSMKESFVSASVKFLGYT